MEMRTGGRGGGGEGAGVQVEECRGSDRCRGFSQSSMQRSRLSCAQSSPHIPQPHPPTHTHKPTRPRPHTLTPPHTSSPLGPGADNMGSSPRT